MSILTQSLTSRYTTQRTLQGSQLLGQINEIIVDPIDFIQLLNSATSLRWEITFSNSLIIHEEKTEEITTVKEVWICDPNHHKIRWTVALNFSKNH